MTYHIKVKRMVRNTEITIETTIDNKEEVGKKLKELHELIQSSIKELSPSLEKTKIPPPMPSFGVGGGRY